MYKKHKFCCSTTFSLGLKYKKKMYQLLPDLFKYAKTPKPATSAAPAAAALYADAQAESA